MDGFAGGRFVGGGFLLGTESFDEGSAGAHCGEFLVDAIGVDFGGCCESSSARSLETTPSEAREATRWCCHLVLQWKC